MSKGEVITIHVDGETLRIIEASARKRRRTLSGFVAEAALKEAVEVERATAGEDSDAGAIEYVPAYFRACCEMARAGGTNGYKFAGYHLASELDRIMPHGISKDEWMTRLGALQQLIWPADLKSLQKQDRERIADWFAAQFPQCMELIPKRRCARFAEGVVELAEEHNGIPGLPG